MLQVKKTITNRQITEVFCQYYNQMYESDGYEYRLTGERLDNILCEERGKLILKSLSLISNEDAFEVGKIIEIDRDNHDFSNVNAVTAIGRQFTRGMLTCDFSRYAPITIKIYQYLQSKGYAFPYLYYSVEDLVELQVFKLI